VHRSHVTGCRRRAGGASRLRVEWLIRFPPVWIVGEPDEIGDRAVEGVGQRRELRNL
jgi:hypothetical protein